MGRTYSKRPTQSTAERFVLVSRALLQTDELNVTDALALTYVHFRWKKRHAVLPSELALHFAWDISTAWRSLAERLADAGWVERCSDGYRPCRPLPRPTPVPKRDEPLWQAPGAGLPHGFLKVPLKNVRELGELEAMTLVQLRTLGDHDKKQLRRDAEGLAGAPSGYLAARFGIHRDTARAVLVRLATGKTRRYKLAVRRGLAAKLQPQIELRKALSVIARVRELGERERAKLTTVTPSRRDLENAQAAAELAHPPPLPS